MLQVTNGLRLTHFKRHQTSVPGFGSVALELAWLTLQLPLTSSTAANNNTKGKKVQLSEVQEEKDC